MALDAASLVRAGSGFAFMGVGVLALAQRDRHVGIPLGIASLAFGVTFAGINLVPDHLVSDGYVVYGVLLCVHALALLWLIARGGWTRDAWTTRAGRWAAGSALLVTLALAPLTAEWALATNGPDLDGVTPTPTAAIVSWMGISAMSFASAAFGIVSALEARRAADARLTPTLGLAALAFTLYPAYSAGITPAYLREPLLVPFVTAAAVALAALAWIPVAHRPGGRVAWLVAWSTLASMAYGMAGSDAPAAASGVGVLRTSAAVVLAIALVRARASHAPHARRALPAGARASVALAVVFIVAQLAQNVLTAQYGLVMGGIVAGAFLFAANPIQRAFEASRAAARDDRLRPAAGPDARETYRKALRLALHDGPMTRAEERHLADLAHDLGIAYPDALRLRDEVEHELASG